MEFNDALGLAVSQLVLVAVTGSNVCPQVSYRPPVYQLLVPLDWLYTYNPSAPDVISLGIDAGRLARLGQLVPTVAVIEVVLSDWAITTPVRVFTIWARTNKLPLVVPAQLLNVELVLLEAKITVIHMSRQLVYTVGVCTLTTPGNGFAMYLKRNTSRVGPELSPMRRSLTKS